MAYRGEEKEEKTRHEMSCWVKT